LVGACWFFLQRCHEARITHHRGGRVHHETAIKRCEFVFALARPPGAKPPSPRGVRIARGARGSAPGGRANAKAARLGGASPGGACWMPATRDEILAAFARSPRLDADSEPDIVAVAHAPGSDRPISFADGCGRFQAARSVPDVSVAGS